MKIKAKCYGVWGDPYYRTEDGHTFCIRETPTGKVVAYFGNVLTGENARLRILTEEEKQSLFDRVEFIK